MAEPNIRKGWRLLDGDHWYGAKKVSKRTEVETPWGLAMAEVGTYIMTSKDDEHQVITSLADLTNFWTTDPVPPPSPPVLGTMTPASPHDPFPPDLPGRDHGA